MFINNNVIINNILLFSCQRMLGCYLNLSFVLFFSDIRLHKCQFHGWVQEKQCLHRYSRFKTLFVFLYASFVKL